MNDADLNSLWQKIMLESGLPHLRFAHAIIAQPDDNPSAGYSNEYRRGWNDARRDFAELDNKEKRVTPEMLATLQQSLTYLSNVTHRITEISDKYGLGDEEQPPAEQSTAFQYRAEQVAKDMQPVYEALGVQQPPAGQGAELPPMNGLWYHGNQVVCCGQFRVFSVNFDTNPAEKQRIAILDWVCNTLNIAADRAARGGS